MATALASAFLARLANREAGQAASSPLDLERELGELVARARAEVPDVELDPPGFVGHVAERITFDRDGRPILAGLRAGPLWIAYGCTIDHAAAIAAFERTYAPEITSALARSFDSGLADDAAAKLRDRLFLVGDDAVPRLASYSGRGDLRAWLRAAAVRTAIDLMRARRAVPVAPQELADAAAFDPILAGVKQRYRDEFRTAFADASQQLTDRERTLLRYKFVDDLSIDEIGTLYRVHRATVARWLAAIRETLFEGTRSRLMGVLELDELEVDSVLRLIDSQLDVSISALRPPK
ncbi:MAG TPA: sigma-70 family RNA polymerase sigma factor [Kofleriaceae bacterium]